MILVVIVFLLVVGVYIYILWNIGGIIIFLLFIGVSIWFVVIFLMVENEVCGLRYIILVLRLDCVNCKYEFNMYFFFCIGFFY